MCLIKVCTLVSNYIELIAKISQITLAIIAILISILVFINDRRHKTLESLNDLLKYFDDNGFFVRMWRLDQITRNKSVVNIKELMEDGDQSLKKLIREAFAEEMENNRSDMFTLYFFALRVSAWYETSKGFYSREKIRLLNRTFGHQLVLTFQNHQLVACRVQKKDEKKDYYPRHYGLFNRQYKNLSKLLEDDLLNSEMVDEDRKIDIRKNRDAIDNHLKTTQSFI